MILCLVLLLIILSYRFWFLPGTLSSGDWPYLYLENIKEMPFSPMVSEYLWLSLYYQIPSKIFVEYLNFPWEVTERVFWFFPFILLTIFSSYQFTKSWLGVLIYSTNTYILMIVGGGQMGVAVAYSVAPLILGRFINLISNLDLHSQNIKSQISNLNYAIITGLILSIQVMFDPRIAYIILIAVFLFLILNFQNFKNFILNFFYILILPLAITTLLNSFWIIPILLHKVDIVERFGTPIVNVESLDFFSFANFSHSFGLLHPNWPENIFGKTYFLRPEFLILPIMAYSSLLFLSAKLQLKAQNLNNNLEIEQFNNRAILYFALLGLIGAFLAKGINEPFGSVYLWLSNYIPGFFMFRDPTKFYLLVALSYSVLIPFSIYSIYEWIKSKIKNYLPNLFLVFTISYLIFLVHPAVLGQLNGTFKPEVVPREYINLKNFLKNESDFSYVLWVPVKQRFGATLEKKPYLNAEDVILADSTSDLINQFKKINTKKLIIDYKIRYIIVPYDSKGEIFLTDRKYDERLYTKTIRELDKIPWLKRINNDEKKDFGKIAVFEVSD